MSLLLVVAGAAAVGYRFGRWWLAAVPLVLGLAVGAVVSAVGGSLHDTPLPFAVVAAMLAVAGGRFARGRLLRL